MSDQDEARRTTSDTAGEARQTATRAGREDEFERREGAAPDSPTEVPKPSWKAVLKRAFAEFSEDKGTDLAAALTYFSVLSLFPMLLALSSLLGVFGQGASTTEALLQVVSDLGVADDQLEVIETYVSNMQGSQGAGLALIAGLLGALWAASNYVNAFSRMMNAVYEVEEGRPVWKLRPVMLLVTLVIVLLIALVGLSLVFTGDVARAVGDVIGLGSTAVTVWNIAKWPVMLAIVILIVALLYWATPNVQQPKFRWISPGAIVAILVWILASVGFGFYVANFGNYNATYGALAGVIIMLIWLYITNITLVLGAEIDAELERGRELLAGMPAEDTMQIPPRDDRQAQKKAEKREKLVEEARRIRLQAGQGDRGPSSG